MSRSLRAGALPRSSTRSAFNPKTGEHFLAPEKYRIHFKMGKQLKYRLNPTSNLQCAEKERET
ncbi:HU family DNA-binding protein [Rickettsiella massiliensis]|uniref:HU family DNA-binding protein n=1 Tax=Rickettsiella massiliensis TaxID=676517 RepID=UPI0038B684E5